MTTEEYKNKVIALFKSGKATEEQWKEMANAVLQVSESNYYDTNNIDVAVDPETPNLSMEVD